MKPVERVNSTNTRSEKDSVKFFSFRKLKSCTETSFKKDDTKITKNSNESKKLCSHISLEENECIHEFPKSTNNIITSTVGQNQSRWTNVNNGFSSLPTRGSRKGKGPGTKVLINSDTFSQTKTLVYTEHQKSPNHCVLGNSDIDASPTNSLDSLNSSNDPDIVAALDQIASTMGLIDEQVSRTSDDPVNYLLKTRSFSERLSIHRNSPCNSARVRSLIDHTESNRKKLDHRSFSKYPTTPVSTKKDSSIRKMMQRLSPKLLRRTKSSSPTKISYSPTIFYKQSEEKDKNTKRTKEDREIVGNNYTNKPGKLSPEENCQQRTNYFRKEETKDHNIVDDNSKRILNSLKIDRIEDPHIKFRHMYKRRSNTPKSDDDDTVVDVTRSMFTDSRTEGRPLLQSYPTFEKTETHPNAKYINISISAFGYGPSIPLSGLPPHRRVKNQAEDVDTTTHILNASGDQHCSIEDDLDKKYP